MRVWRSTARPYCSFASIDAVSAFWSAPRGNVVIMEEDAFYDLLEAFDANCPCSECGVLINFENEEHDKMRDHEGNTRCDYCAGRH